MYSELALKKAFAIEEEVTEDLMSLQSEIGVLKGLEHRIKPFDRILEKTVSDSIIDYGGSFKRAANNINDSVRYTFVIPDDKYIENIDKCLHRLEDIGYQVVEFKNKWRAADFKGINVRLVAKNNNDIFEIQFHTPLAYRIKEGDSKSNSDRSTRALYQVSRDKRAPEWLRLKADKLRRYLQTFIMIPDGALEYQFDRDIRRSK